MHQAKKKFGQNFITDGNLIEKIISQLSNESDQLVIEIGPGQGALTKKLVKKYKKVIAIEIDKDLENILLSSIVEENFELIIGDFLEVDLNKIIKQNNFKKVSIISNTPYYIISPIIFKCFESQEFLSKAVLMVQKEVGERICAEPSNKNYNNLSIISKFYSTPKYLFTINRNLFKPVPLVDSALIELNFEKNSVLKVKDPNNFAQFLRKIFNNKRKTILNNLANYLKSKDKSEDILTKHNIKLNLRPENLTLDDYIILFNEVSVNEA
ncbi:dimethyladenosine transferase [Spiroplasma corruscae]|uniref:Ribosomal RNA small subunit methyltransferase A n=1 Tax=Spiroplasma corruscae TaxID=216934 RepID=A0A222EQB6_9MOLU|nr:16S rRNA (adenine(1518)-N(6)/adenine(1519)-N(6))-dimethyltransferase RsmA [Spiroplasma corruscae]ASP28765.1 dimethyladenosine transferase [Spiroplasma corruscae]